MSVTTQIETITPSKAVSMLEKNLMNRPMNERNLNSLVEALKNGTFNFTGESIKFSKEDILLDGQHRLAAIVKSGIPVKTIIIRGLEPESFKYMDIGRQRLASDVLSIEGVKNAARIAGITKFVSAFSKGNYNKNKWKQKGAGLTNAMVSEFVSKNIESLNDSYEFGFCKGKRLISGQTIAGMHYVLKQINESQADDFINKLVEGTNLTKQSPITMLREKFINDTRAKRKMGQTEKIALIVKAWNLYREDKKVSILKWDADREEFPKAK